MKEEKVPISESFLVGSILATVGGYMDVYTYINRGEVFANAQTGNILFLGMNLAQGDFRQASNYFISILAFIIGTMLARAVKWKPLSLLNWKQITILLEIIILCIVGFIRGDMLANILVSFVSALQIETFRKLAGKAYTTTICTGNLRSGSEILYDFLKTKEKEKLKASMQYFGVILAFIIGAIISIEVTSRIGAKAILLSSIGLIIVFALLFEETKGSTL